MHLEMLEPRLLFSSATATVASDGTLIINGTPARERIRVMLWLDLSGGAWRITINGHAPHLHPPSSPDWPYWLPSALVIRAAGGNDSIKVDTPLGEVPTTILAGDGDDTITTDARHTIIFGGNGNDKITVDSNDADPNSIVFGGDGDDLITGSDKANYLHGGNGNDTLIGGGGNDQLFGEAGNDVLEGGDGIDTFFGGDGRDKILSGDANGDEPVDGGNGFDLVYFPNDCSVPWDDMVSIYRINVIGTDRWWFCMI